MARVVAPDAAYVVVKGDAAARAPLARLLAGPMYVDMNRVLRDAAPAAAG